VLFANLDPDPDIRFGLESARDPCEANDAARDLAPDKSLGSCVGFSKYTLWLASRDLKQGKQRSIMVSMTNWNLDSDRGYGYHCWDFNRRTDAKPYPLDPNGHPYPPPCVWPSQADAPAVYRADIEQKVHWVGPGLTDPGCAAPDCAKPSPPPIK
jgi:hypothetical protein